MINISSLYIKPKRILTFLDRFLGIGSGGGIESMYRKAMASQKHVFNFLSCGHTPCCHLLIPAARVCSETGHTRKRESWGV